MLKYASFLLLEFILACIPITTINFTSDKTAKEKSEMAEEKKKSMKIEYHKK